MRPSTKNPFGGRPKRHKEACLRLLCAVSVGCDPSSACQLHRGRLCRPLAVLCSKINRCLDISSVSARFEPVAERWYCPMNSAACERHPLRLLPSVISNWTTSLHWICSLKECTRHGSKEPRRAFHAHRRR